MSLRETFSKCSMEVTPMSLINVNTNCAANSLHGTRKSAFRTQKKKTMLYFYRTLAKCRALK